ncbi:hypothetical protein GBA52_020807 [Prunus armeniaca]|nr:hypothetical protein GBA52_020807 [Prunus armeniaca]
MSSLKNTQPRVHEEKSRISRSIHNKSSSFHGQFPDMELPQLRRPKTVPYMGSFRPKLTRILLNVMIQGSVGIVQVLMPLDLTVKDLVATALQ